MTLLTQHNSHDTAHMDTSHATSDTCTTTTTTTTTIGITNMITTDHINSSIPPFPHLLSMSLSATWQGGGR